MLLEKISFLNVRKIKNFSEKLSTTTTIIIGNNGSGKTTILEAIFFLLTSKSFRKKHSKAIIQKGKQELKIKGTIYNKKQDTIQINYKDKKKQITKNNKPIKTTSELLKQTLVVSASPEEENIIESYQSGRRQYFDKIIFKNKTKHTRTTKEYNKLLKIRNTLLETNQNTEHWDHKTVELGIKIWDRRKVFFTNIEKHIYEVCEKIKDKNNFTVKYKPNSTKDPREYTNKLKEKTKTPQTNYGPHKDQITFLLNGENLQENGSQGEKKLLRYILKLAEAE